MLGRDLPKGQTQKNSSNSDDSIKENPEKEMKEKNYFSKSIRRMRIAWRQFIGKVLWHVSPDHQSNLEFTFLKPNTQNYSFSSGLNWY